MYEPVFLCIFFLSLKVLLFWRERKARHAFVDVFGCVALRCVAFCVLRCVVVGRMNHECRVSSVECRVTGVIVQIDVM